MHKSAGGTGSSPAPVHPLQFLLEIDIEQLMPVKPEKREELPRPLQPLDDELLLLGEFDRGLPTLHRPAPPAVPEWPRRRADDHGERMRSILKTQAIDPTTESARSAL